MEQLQLDALNITGVQIIAGLQHRVTVFSRKTENDMHDDLNADGPQLCDGSSKAGERIASPDKTGGIFVDRLQSELDPDRLDPVQTVKQCEYLVAKAVRACGNGKRDDFRIGYGFQKDTFQIFYRSVGVRVCLKVGDIFMDRTLFGDQFFCIRSCSEIGRTAGAAKSPERLRCRRYSRRYLRFVPVRTGHATV